MLKSPLNGKWLQTIYEIKKNTMSQLIAFLKEDSADYFEKKEKMERTMYGALKEYFEET